MPVVKSGKREPENPREIEVQGVVALKVIALGELDDAASGVQIQMRPDIEAFEIVKRLPQLPAAQALAAVFPEQHVPHLYSPLHGDVQDSTIAGDAAYRSGIGRAVRCFLEKPGKRNAGIEHQLDCH